MKTRPKTDPAPNTAGVWLDTVLQVGGIVGGIALAGSDEPIGYLVLLISVIWYRLTP